MLPFTSLVKDECGSAYNVIPINPPESLQERLKAQDLGHSLAKIKMDKKRKQEDQSDKLKRGQNSTMRDTFVSDTVKLVQRIASQDREQSAAEASIFNTGQPTRTRWNDILAYQVNFNRFH